MKYSRLFFLWIASLAFMGQALASYNKIELDEQSRFYFRFITSDLDYVDGRPVFSPDGKYVVFMRQPNNNDPSARSSLYRVKIYDKSVPELLFDGINPDTNQPFNATRPDYSWKRDRFEIAFDALDDGIWLLDVKTKEVRQVLQQRINGQDYTFSYPAWYRDGKFLAVTNYNLYGAPFYHQLVKADARELNEFTTLTDNQVVWTGMSSVNLKKSSQLAFAGQAPVSQPPQTCDCYGGCLDDGYAQNCNQIWMKTKAGTFPIDALQGRAPWFSPNGKYIVFESNRGNPDYPERYRLYIYSIKKNKFWVITPPALNVQHAKWSPDGKKLVFAVELTGGAQGLAIVELN